MDILKQLENEINCLEKKPNKKVHTEIIDKKSLEVLKDIEKNHNTAWSVFMYERNKKSKALDKTAILYRGNKITYRETYIKAYEYAKSLKKLGFKKGDKLMICISDIPEYIYIDIACNFIGVEAHFIGSYFEHVYISSIINNNKYKGVFASEDNYKEISPVIENSNIKNVILVSLEDSLMKKDGKPYNPYQEVEYRHDYKSKIDSIKKESSKKILSQDEFIEIGKLYNGRVIEEQTLDDIATISYTSGTTSKNNPKGVKHSNRAYISSSRFKSSDVSKMPEMKNLVGMATIPLYSYTHLSTITDVLYCNCTYACEPFKELSFFMKSLLINKPNFVESTIGPWLYLGKQLLLPMYKKVKMPFLMLPEIVGESCSPGEEKFLNKIAREHSFGTAKLPFPLAPVTFMIGGGSCEAGGLFFTIFHELRNKLLKLKNSKYNLGLLPSKLAEINVLNDDLGYCSINEPGILVSNSPACMSGYLDESLNKDAYITDKYGKKWMKIGAIGYIAEPYNRSVAIKGRINDYVYLKNGEKFPTYKIQDCILKDTKNIMSCTVIKNDNNEYICHIERQPDYKKVKNINDILLSCKSRLSKEIPEEIIPNINFRVRSNFEGFPLDISGKRSIKKLMAEKNGDMIINIEDITDTETVKLYGIKAKRL